MISCDTARNSEVCINKRYWLELVKVCALVVFFIGGEQGKKNKN